MNTSKTIITITESTSIHRRRRASQRQEVLPLPAKMFNIAIRINTIHNLATSNIQLMAQSHCKTFPIYVATSQQTSWRALLIITMVAHITTKTMWPIKNPGTKDQSSSQGNRKRKASAQGARKAQMAQEAQRTKLTQSSPARVTGSEGIMFATCARLISKMWRRSFILAIANIRFVTGVTITKYRPRRGSALTAASTTR